MKSYSTAHGSSSTRVSVCGKFQKVSGDSGGSGDTSFKSEIQLQAACWQWTWNTYPETRRLIAHVPNGSSRDKREAMQLKASGVVPGVHDLFFYWQGQLYWFELKIGNNKQSDDQEKFGAAMAAHGAICHEIRTLEQFQEIFKSIIATPKW